jgi:hypothetical protein
VPLRLIPPGKRKGNKHFIVRGRFLGVDIERSCETSSPKDAAEYKARLEIELLRGDIPTPGADIKFHRACDLYLAAKPHLSPKDRRAVEHLKQGIADKSLASIVQADIDTAASTLYPGNSPESIARLVYTPAGAVLHYAAENHWRGWLRLKRPKQKEPETRAATDAAATALLKATTGKKHLLLLWLFQQGSRISTALSVDCARISLETREYEIYVSKSRIWRTFPIDDEVYEALLRDPDMMGFGGRLFPWSDPSSVYFWLRPLVKELGIIFTPHMARHRLGKKMRKHGLRTIMDALGQTNPKSAFRYVASDIEAVRDAMKSLGSPLGKHRRKPRRY